MPEYSSTEKFLNQATTTSVKAVKLIVIISLIAGVLGGLFWAIFYSAYFANYPFAISARDRYISLIRKATNDTTSLNPVYVIQAQPEMGGIKYYSFSGTFDHIDTASSFIFVKGADKNIYVFMYGNNINKINNGTLNAPYNPPETGPQPAKSFVKQVITSVDDAPYTTNSKIAISWDDTRTLSQILSDYSKDPNIPLNINSKELFTFIKIN